MQKDRLKIDIKLFNNQSIILELFPETENSLYEIDATEANNNAESQYQLVEGKTYEYSITRGFNLEASDIVNHSKVNSSSGHIRPGIYVGTLTIPVIETKTHSRCGEISLEVQSIKTTYREDYRLMLRDIAEKCTDLVMQQGSHVTQLFTIDQTKESETLYQKFAFIKSMLCSEEFNNAIHKIISSPVTNWIEKEMESDIRKLRKANSKTLQKIATAKNRMKLPQSHSLSNKMDSVPSKINMNRKEETVNTPENQFIKFTLSTFLSFCNTIRTNKKANNKLVNEVIQLEDILEQHLNHAFFKKLSEPSTLPLNNPVLQKKEGYREIFKIWAMFDLAAKLTWKGGEDVYRAGKKDIAVLYEYWVFFKLLDILQEIFHITPKSINKLIKSTDDGLGLQLKQGKHFPVEGIYYSSTRELWVQLSYNRSFQKKGVYPIQGSWSINMRPDYTLSIWPYGITQKEAEQHELIVHIHFDAKYKIERIAEIFEAEEDLDTEKFNQRKELYKRADILKMHSYKDAIRRSAGAYVLYPGTETKTERGFHEIIPGLGAFPIKPAEHETGSAELKKFIQDVTDHFLNRTSQREKMYYQTYAILNSPAKKLKEKIPELYGENRNLIPDETYVLVGYYKNQSHLEWIQKKGLYNARMDSRRGSLRLGVGESSARYLLLHSEGETVTNKLFRIIENGPRVFSAEKLKELEYPFNSHEAKGNYLIYKIDGAIEEEFQGRSWNISKLKGFKKGRGSALPFSTTLAELMETVEK